MSTQAELPKGHPMRDAWETYSATDEYANTRRWALTEAHVDGSLWAAFIAGYAAALPAVPETLTADDVKWVVNDIAELGVMIRGQCFFLYKGNSLVYRDAIHDDGTPMHYRPVGKREFGECCHPINHSDYSKHGTVSLDDSDDWKPLLAAPAQEAKS